MQGHEPSLVQRAVAGDEAALTVLLTQSYADMMDRLAGRTPTDLRPVLDPEDIVQETHVEVFRHIGDFEPHGPKSFDRWVATIALNRLRNAIKKYRSAKHGGGRLVGSAHAGRLEKSVVALLDFVEAGDRSPSRSAAGHEAVQAIQGALTEISSIASPDRAIVTSNAR